MALELIRGASNLRERHRGCVATIGNFDGVHLGHRAVVEQLAAIGQEHDLPTTLITFEPQPQEFFAGPNAPARLSRLREKVAELARLPVNRLLVLRFDERLSRSSPDGFIEDLLVSGLGVRCVVVGDDFRFGHRGEGTFGTLVDAGARHGFEVVKRGTFTVDGDRVSSTRIRDRLLEGDMDAAAALLGRPYSMRGKVVRGDQRGRTIGFPTLNVPLLRNACPLRGVYAVQVRGLVAGGDTALGGMANVGTRPTVGGDKLLLEVHVFDWTGDAYGRPVEVCFLEKLRDERKFESFDALRAQLDTDRESARTALGIRA